MSPHLPFGRLGRSGGSIRRGPIAQPAVQHAHAFVEGQSLRDLAISHVVRVVEHVEIAEYLRVDLVALGPAGRHGRATWTSLTRRRLRCAGHGRGEAEKGGQGDSRHPAIPRALERHRLAYPSPRAGKLSRFLMTSKSSSTSSFWTTSR